MSVRPAAERDIPEILVAYQDDPQLYVRLGRERPPSGAELGRNAERAEGDRRAGAALTLTVLDAGQDTCLGQINVDNVDWDHARAQLGIWIAPERRREALGRRALTLVAPWLLERCGLQRVQILTEPDNEPMIDAARAAGFAFEGVLRGYTRERQTRVDAAVLSFVRADLAA